MRAKQNVQSAIPPCHIVRPLGDQQTNRRAFLWTAATLPILFFSQAGHAGEIGAKITKAVTESDLVIPDPKPIDAKLASRILEISDEIFCDAAKIRQLDLEQRIAYVSDKVRPSFERSGLSVSETSIIETGEQFNFASYSRFKAYSELLIERKVDFRTFKQKFDDRFGKELLTMVMPESSLSLEKRSGTLAVDRKRAIGLAKQRMDALSTALVDKGMVAAVDISPLEDIDDWVQELADLSWSVGLDGDITMPSQILLQSQGIRFYPNYAHLMIQTILQQELPNLKTTIEDYYLETDYNSDPEKFEVKEVLVNINIEN